MTQGSKPPVRRLDAGGLTAAPPQMAGGVQRRPAPAAQPSGLRVRPVAEAVAAPQPPDDVPDHDVPDDDGYQYEYDAGPVQPIGEPVAHARRPDVKAADEPQDLYTVKLSKLYRAHDLEVGHVRFREPVTREIRKAGYPLRGIVGPDGRPQSYEILADVVAKYIMLLSDPPLPESTVNEFTVTDLNACSAVITDFFLK